MTLYRSRERFGKVSVKIGTAFSRLGLSPNQWTLLSLVPVSVAVFFLWREEFLAAAALFLVSSFLDLVDGSVARVTGRVSLKGAYLDTIADRYVEFAVVLGILLAGIPGFLIPGEAWLLAFLFGAMMTTYSKAAAKEKGLVEKELRGGLLERAERLVILFLGIALAHFGKIYLTYVVALLAVLSNISALQRMYSALSGKGATIPF